MNITIRPENASDPHEGAVIAALHAEAFGSPGHGALPAALRAADFYRSQWALVAVSGDQIVGHVMVTYAFLDTGDERVRIPSLSPLAVLPDRQRQGIGGALVAAAVSAVDAGGEPFVVLEGSPVYYARLGFEDARTHGVVFALPEWAPPEAGQLHPLTNYRRIDGRVVYPAHAQAAFDAVG